MGDTQFFGKTLSGTSKAMLLYVGTSVALAIGGSMFSLDQKEWDSWWWMKRAGWAFILLGNVFNTIKAFYSNSSPTAVAK